MEVTQILNQHGIDIALNAAGYLIAAALGMVIFSLFSRRREPVVAATAETPLPETKATTAKSTEPARPVEAPRFVSLKRSEEGRVAGNSPKTESAPTTSSRRDRVEIIRLAREMVKAGAPHENIKRTLPISDGELALLAQANR